MDFCSDHKDNCRKIFVACQAIGKIDRVESDIESLYTTIFGEGDSNSLKSRIKGTEDALSGLKDLVLENRNVMSEKIAGLFKIFCLTITAASVMICIAFGVMWAEMKSVNESIATLQHYQIREPAPSPQLPFKPLHEVKP